MMSDKLGSPEDDEGIDDFGKGCLSTFLVIGVLVAALMFYVIWITL